MTHPQPDIHSLKQKLEQVQQNIRYLEAQAAAYGALNVPLKLHNDLAEERKHADALRAALDDLLKRGAARARAAVKAGAGAPAVLVADDDVYWQAIVAEVAAALGCHTATCRPFELRSPAPGPYRMLVIGLPHPQTFAPPHTLTAWTAAAAQICAAVPTILLASAAEQPVSMALRQGLAQHNAQPVATIQKETFDHDWFIKMFKKALT
ncbi:MAG: hypothetical protein ACE5G8_02135 [Anaerolineae bacterium]